MWSKHYLPQKLCYVCEEGQQVVVCVHPEQRIVDYKGQPQQKEIGNPGTCGIKICIVGRVMEAIKPIHTILYIGHQAETTF